MPKQMPKYGTLTFPGETSSLDLALGATLTEAARNQDSMHVFEMGRCRIGALENLRFDPVEFDSHPVGDARHGSSASISDL